MKHKFQHFGKASPISPIFILSPIKIGEINIGEEENRRNLLNISHF
jgi:hypothetical protein